MDRSPAREKKVGVSTLIQKKQLFSGGSCMATRRNIIDGPSKFDLMISLFAEGGADYNRVSFTVLEVEGEEHTGEIHVAIMGMDRYDSGVNDWLFRGFSPCKIVHGSYSTKTRKGWIEDGER